MKFNFKIALPFATILVMAIVLSCSSGDYGPANVLPINAIELARKEQIVNLYDKQIFPLQELHVSETAILFEKAQEFSASPNLSTLSALKLAWKSSFLIWKRAEIYNLGPIQTSFIHLSIDQFPINTSVIDNNINSSSIAIDDSYVSGIGAQAKGYAALEYLLYDNDENSTLNAFTSAQHAARRLQYLVALAKNLDVKSNELKDKWTAYETDFKSNLSTGVSGSQNQVVNAMIAAIENIKNKKIGAAINLTPANPELLEAYRSKTSRQAITNNIRSFTETFTGDYNNVEGFGLDQYITETLGRGDLKTAITASINSASAAFDALEDPLEDNLVSQQAEAQNFNDKLTQLIAIFKVDLASAASIVVTFNDNDGD